MISHLFNTIFFEPLYNTLVFLVSVLPGHNLGLAIIFLTVLVRVITFPLTHKSTLTQRKMKLIEPEIKNIKNTYKNKEEQARKTMELYKQHGISPFSGFFLMLIQFPVLIALFLLFKEGFVLRTEDMYYFVDFPKIVNTLFLGIDLSKTSYVWAVLSGVSQFVQIQLSFPKIPKTTKTSDKKAYFGSELQKSMAFQTKYIMPFFIFFIALKFSSGIALYWTTSNIFAIVHEIGISKMSKKIKIVKKNGRTDSDNKNNDIQNG
jgi:YidC/Oxa1 family membrane protein insertase